MEGDEADDVVQDIFVKVYRSLNSFKGDSSFYTWLYRIAVNLSLNEIRRKKTRKTFAFDDSVTQYESDEILPLERMEREGIVGAADGAKPREVLIRPVGQMPGASAM